MHTRFAAAVLLAALTLTGCRVTDTSTEAAGSTPRSARVPDVVGDRLSDAQKVLHDAGFRHVRTTDGTGRNRLVLSSVNWIVRAQDPAGGATASTGSKILLTVTKPTDSAGSGGIRVGVVPNVVCRDLQSAQDALRSAGFFALASTDGTGRGRRQILDRDWVVIGQSVGAGQRPDRHTRIVLTVVKFGEPTGHSGCRS
jgi:hypothetical protein